MPRCRSRRRAAPPSRCRSRCELLASRLEFGAQFGVVLDDAVVHDRDARGAVRMRVALGRRAMRRPSRVADAGVPAQRQSSAAARLPACPRRGGARCGRSPAWRCRRCHSRDIPAGAAHRGSAARPARADDADDAAHLIDCPACWSSPCAPIAATARPGLFTCRRARRAPAHPAATSSVITLPAATMAPSPTVTGATSAVSEPMNARAPIVGAMLVVAVVVAGDRPGADVRLRRRSRASPR